MDKSINLEKIVICQQVTVRTSQVHMSGMLFSRMSRLIYSFFKKK